MPASWDNWGFKALASLVLAASGVSWPYGDGGAPGSQEPQDPRLPGFQAPNQPKIPGSQAPRIGRIGIICRIGRNWEKRRLKCPSS